ncbi:MAG: hypothetical protein RKP20_17405 [Candidatus Competibacter sp.]|nr:hypothetical protein [Candidatus Competibacter sp.]
MNTLVCPLSMFRLALFGLAGHPDEALYLTVGRRLSPPAREWLGRELRHRPPPEPFFTLRRRAGGEEPFSLSALLAAAPPAQQGWLWIGAGAGRDSLWGRVRLEQTTAPLHQVWLVGAGMHCLPVLDAGLE